MTLDEAKDLSHLLARIGSHFDQSVAFVRDHDTPENFEEYRTVVGKLMGDLYLDAMVPLYNIGFPSFCPTISTDRIRFQNPHIYPDSTEPRQAQE